MPSAEAWLGEQARLLLPATDLFGESAAMGLLTPTVTKLHDGRLRVFVAARCADGRSEIVWVDLDPGTLDVVGTSSSPVLGRGIAGAFDEDGVILGDYFVDSVSGQHCLAYVGFQRLPSIKFRALTGMAVSDSPDGPFRRVGQWSIDRERDLGTRYIETVHNVTQSDAGFEALVAIGTSWWTSPEGTYPEYSSWLASGPDLLSLRLGPGPVLGLPVAADVYRLGRPRRIQIFDEEYVVATGMTKSGLYRPYVFAQNPSQVWEWLADFDLGVFPGCHPFAQRQASYPVTCALSENQALVLWNGDEMGKHGVLGRVLRRE